MGWYVTCEICNVEGKYGLNCDCYEEETKKNLNRLKGCVIEDSVVVSDPCFSYLFQKLKPKEGPVFYMRICIKDGGGEYTCWRRAVEIKDEEFINREKFLECEDECVGDEASVSTVTDDELRE